MDLVLALIDLILIVMGVTFANIAVANRATDRKPGLMEIESFTPLGQVYVRRFWMTFVCAAVVTIILWFVV